MSWWYLSPLESSSVRNIARYDHHYVPLTQDGLVCSPGYFDRLLDDDSNRKRNSIERSDAQQFLQAPQLIPAEILYSLLAKNTPNASASSNPPETNHNRVKSFAGDPIFLLHPSATLDGRRQTFKSEPPTRDSSPRRKSHPAVLADAADTVEGAVPVEDESENAEVAINAGVPFLPMVLDSGCNYLTLISSKGGDSQVVEFSTNTAASRGRKERSEKARKTSNTTTKNSNTSDEISPAPTTNGNRGGAPNFDESRDADDEASSGKTISSSSEEFQRKLSLLAEEASIHHAYLYRRPIEDFGLQVDTTLGTKLVIKQVIAGSNAFIEGLAVGDIVLALNNKTVGGSDGDLDFYQAIKMIQSHYSLHMVVAKCIDSLGQVTCKRTTIELRNSPDGLGLTIGKNSQNRVVIKGITTGGVAFKDRRLKRGDQILKISGVFTENLTTEEVGKLLKNSGKLVKLDVLQPIPNAESLVAVNLKRSSKYGLGLGVAIYTSKLNETSTVVRNMLPNSPADRNNKISLDDEVISINGKQTSRMTAEEILELLKNKSMTHYSLLIRPCGKEFGKTRKLKAELRNEACCSGTFFKQISKV